ncbi:MAG: glycosyltransferase family 39 protein [Synechococcus sp.]|nr:glycosyltransferase family 39 protein [Synechococcus sp.]
MDHGRALGLLAGGGWPGWDGLLDLSPKIPPLASLVSGTVMALVGTQPDQACSVLAVWHGLLLVVVALWGRQLVSPGFGLLAAALTTLVPGLAELRLSFTLDLALTACTTLALWLLGRWQAPPPGRARWGLTVAAALAVAAAVLVKQSALLVLLAPCLWAAGQGLGQRGRRLPVLLALGVVLAVCAPWLHHNWISTIGGTNRAVIESAAAEGDPAVFSLDGWLWYLRQAPRQLGLPLLLGALLGGGWALGRAWRQPGGPAALAAALRRPVRHWGVGWPWLLGCTLACWVLITLSPNKDGRYLAPLLPLLVLLLAHGWWSLGAALQRGWPGGRGAALVLLLGLGSATAALALPRQEAIARRQRSPLPQAMEFLRSQHPGEPLALLVLPGLSDLNDHTATFYGRQEGGQVLARSLGRNPAEHDLVLERADWLLLATGDQGHRRETVRQLSRRVRSDGRFERVKSWRWTKGREVELWRRTAAAPPVPRFDASFVALANGLAEGPRGLARVLDAIGPQHQLDPHFLYQPRVEQAARQRLARNPSDTEALWSLTLLAILRERPAQAAHWLERLEALLPENPWPAAYRAAVLLIDWQPWPARDAARTHPLHGREPVLQGLGDLAALLGGDPRALGSLPRSLPQAYARIDRALEPPASPSMSPAASPRP